MIAAFSSVAPTDPFALGQRLKSSVNTRVHAFRIGAGDHGVLSVRAESERTNASIRSVASRNFSKLVAKQQRTNPSPEPPKASPGTTATFCDSNRPKENCLLVSPVEPT